MQEEIRENKPLRIKNVKHRNKGKKEFKRKIQEIKTRRRKKSKRKNKTN